MALLLHMAEFMQARMIVFPKPPRIEVDHVFELVQAVLHLDHLVDLFLILDDDEACTAMIEDICHLFGCRVLVKRHGDRTHGLRRDHRPIQLRTVAADDGDEIAFVDAKVYQPKREVIHFALNVLPRPGLPDAEFLFAERGLVRELLGVALQQRRYGHESTGRL